MMNQLLEFIYLSGVALQQQPPSSQTGSPLDLPAIQIAVLAAAAVAAQAIFRDVTRISHSLAEAVPVWLENKARERTLRNDLIDKMGQQISDLFDQLETANKISVDAAKNASEASESAARAVQMQQEQEIRHRQAVEMIEGRLKTVMEEREGQDALLKAAKTQIQVLEQEKSEVEQQLDKERELRIAVEVERDQLREQLRLANEEKAVLEKRLETGNHPSVSADGTQNDNSQSEIGKEV